MTGCEHYYCYWAGLQAFFEALFDDSKAWKSYRRTIVLLYKSTIVRL